ncbi:MAG TPA: phage tail protein [Roseiflexaceae bacterium]|nr:phage tail protein [Roseiflexaceae bacterium]
MATRSVYSTYRFWVEIEGINEAAFSECSGLQVETEVFEWEEGGLNTYKHRLPVRTRFSNLTLKRGIASAELWKWYDGVIQGARIQRRNLSVVLYGYDGMPQVRWDVVQAFPVKWVGPTLKTGAGEAAVETLELAHHGFTRR